MIPRRCQKRRLPLFIALAHLSFVAEPRAVGPAETGVEIAGEPSVSGPILVPPAAGPLRIDGVLDEPAWGSAARLDGFTQQVPRPGEPASEPTRVLLLHDENALYFGVSCDDSEPQAILARTLARDDFAHLADDLFVVAIDAGLSRRDGVWFATNPLGTQFDAQVFNEGRIFDTAWDGVWEARALRHASGWTVEIRIPFSNLRFGRGAGAGINFHRLIRRRNEETYLPAIPRDLGDEATFSRALPVRLEGVRGGAALQFKPFLLGERSRAATPGAEPIASGQGGFDLKWGVTPTLAADLTFHTDFAETEVDQQQINLTRFDLFYPEKREFFLENAGLFQFGFPGELQVFHSRRIGLENGEPVPLWGGARLSGRVGRAMLGVLDIVQRDTPDVPRTNFGVVRLRHDLGERGSAGIILTDRRQGDAPGSGEVTGEAAGGQRNRVGGADFVLPFAEEYRVEGFVADSRTPGVGGDGRAAWLRVAREGDLWQYSLDYTRVDPDFDAGTGFVQRSDQRRRRASLAWRPRPTGSAVRQWRFLYSPTYLTDSENRLMTRLHFIQSEAELQAGDTLSTFFLDDFERLLTPFEIAPGVVIPSGEYHNHESQVSLATSPNRPWSSSGFANTGDFFDGRRRILGASLTARAGPHLTLGAEFIQNRVRLPADEFSTRLGLLRVHFAFSARLFGGVLIQSNSFTDEVGLNLRLDWIHAPGSDLYFVYNRLLRAPDETSVPSGAERDTAILKVTRLWRF